jgi:hypothetical protein
MFEYFDYFDLLSYTVNGTESNVYFFLPVAMLCGIVDCFWDHFEPKMVSNIPTSSDYKQYSEFMEAWSKVNKENHEIEKENETRKQLAIDAVVEKFSLDTDHEKKKLVTLMRCCNINRWEQSRYNVKGSMFTYDEDGEIIEGRMKSLIHDFESQEQRIQSSANELHKKIKKMEEDGITIETCTKDNDHKFHSLGKDVVLLNKCCRNYEVELKITFPFLGVKFTDDEEYFSDIEKPKSYKKKRPSQPLQSQDQQPPCKVPKRTPTEQQQVDTTEQQQVDTTEQQQQVSQPKRRITPKVTPTQPAQSDPAQSGDTPSEAIVVVDKVSDVDTKNQEAKYRAAFRKNIVNELLAKIQECKEDPNGNENFKLYYTEKQYKGVDAAMKLYDSCIQYPSSMQKSVQSHVAFWINVE